MAEIASHESQVTSHELFSEAKKFIPGGVNSPVRSFEAVGGKPVFIKRGMGSKVYGECGGEFIDYCLSWGALIFGHAYPAVRDAVIEAVRNGTSFGAATKSETELARLITEAVPSIERVRLTNSGTEAVMAAVRLARAYTARDKIIKFDGAYHGHADYLLGKAGSGRAASGVTTSPGVPGDFTKHTISVPYNDIERIKSITEKHRKDLAAIIVEPVAANCGVVIPKIGFLQELRDVTARYGILLIFDEVITGFRLSYGGAQELFSVRPDLTCLGKIIGGGFPVGAFGGRKEIMELLAPAGGVYQAGTLSGNPVAVTAGIATLNNLKERNPYARLKNRTKKLCNGIEKIGEGLGIDVRINYIASVFSVFFTGYDVTDFSSAGTQDARFFKKFYHGLLKRGIYFSPSGFEANFLSTAHKEEDIDRTLAVIEEALKDIKEGE